MRAFLPKLLCLATLCLWAPLSGFSDEAAKFGLKTSFAYKSGASLSDYEKERCQLDLYLPPTGKDLPVLVWFHGGGLTQGKKDDDFTAKIAQQFVQQGLAVVAVNYRLSPKATYPAYVEDAAASVAWVLAHAKEHRIDPKKIFVGGHSAGGYLAALIGIDPRWLKAQGGDADKIAGLIPISGQMMTHYTIRQERGLPDFKNRVVADEAAPVYYIRKDTPPWLILYADRDMATRAEENVYFASGLVGAGNKRVTSKLITDRDHGNIAGKMAEPGDPTAAAVLEFIRKYSEGR